MRIYRFLGSFCIAAALAAPALAADAKPQKEKKICRSEDVTGSIMRKTTCHTREEWRQLDEQRQRNAESALDRAHAGGVGRIE